jgi:phospholipase C
VEPVFIAPGANDDHPPHDIMRGQAFLSTILHALAEGPQWQRSMVILTYDEHGGFFDHVPPPTVEDERSADGFGQLGVRVPGLVISPYSHRGVVSSTLYEHSSVPAFLEWLFGLEPLTVRDAQANYFIDTFDVDRIRRNDPRPFPTLPVVDLDPDQSPECIELGQATVNELALFADAGGIPPSFDRRRDAPELLRRLNRELIDMGGARTHRRR